MTMPAIARAALGLLATVAASAALAQPAGEPTDLPVIGVPVPGGVNYQPAVTEIAHDTHWLSHTVHGIMLAIVLLVLVLITIVIVRYNSRRNPNPASFTHNTRIEIAWTLVPVVILIVIGSFSLPVLYKQVEIPEPDLTIKATGNQWFWTYDYPDNEFSFDALMLAEEDLEAYGYAPDLHLLATDNAVVVPVGAVVRLQVTGADVIHSWTIPAFGVKMDAVPGRLNETWFTAEDEGVYFGQCSELCGKDHSYMPITVKAVSEEQYEEWLAWAIAEYGGVEDLDVAEPPAAGTPSAAEVPDELGPGDVEANPEAGGPDDASPSEAGAAEGEAPAEEMPPEAPADAGAPVADPADAEAPEPGSPEVPASPDGDAPGGDTAPEGEAAPAEETGN
jgi:cytochrome c oxidase subunit 2